MKYSHKNPVVSKRKSKLSLLVAVSVMALGLSMLLVLNQKPQDTRSLAGIELATTHYPVILSHGWVPTPLSSLKAEEDKLLTMKAWFQQEGYPTYIAQLPGNENIQNAKYLSELVQKVKTETGAPKVHLVSHSMGGLATRYYIKVLNGESNIATWTGFGTPNYGTSISCLQRQNEGGQMCPSSSFLKTLNNGDDTPGSLPYTTLWGTAQDDPKTSARLDGGACFGKFDGVKHADEMQAKVVFDLALQAVKGVCPGMFADSTEPVTTGPTPASSPITPTISVSPSTLPITGEGLLGSYFSNNSLNGEPVLTQIDKTINFDWSFNSPTKSLPRDNFSVRWTGYVVPAYSETYTFYTLSDDQVRLWINDKLVLDNWKAHWATENKGIISLAAGQKYAIKMEYAEKSLNAVAKLYWSSPSTPKQTIPQASLLSE